MTVLLDCHFVKSRLLATISRNEVTSSPKWNNSFTKWGALLGTCRDSDGASSESSESQAATCLDTARRRSIYRKGDCVEHLVANAGLRSIWNPGLMELSYNPTILNGPSEENFDSIRMQQRLFKNLMTYKKRYLTLSNFYKHCSKKKSATEVYGKSDPMEDLPPSRRCEPSSNSPNDQNLESENAKVTDEKQVPHLTNRRVSDSAMLVSTSNPGHEEFFQSAVLAESSTVWAALPPAGAKLPRSRRAVSNTTRKPRSQRYANIPASHVTQFPCPTLIHTLVASMFTPDISDGSQARRAGQLRMRLRRQGMEKSKECILGGFDEENSLGTKFPKNRFCRRWSLPHSLKVQSRDWYSALDAQALSALNQIQVADFYVRGTAQKTSQRERRSSNNLSAGFVKFLKSVLGLVADDGNSNTSSQR